MLINNAGTVDNVSIEVVRSRYVKDGKIGVVISPRFGGGFSTWGPSEMALDPVIVELVLQEDDIKLNEYLQTKYSYDFIGNVDELTVKWLDPGTRFYIQEYDGSEDIVTENDVMWLQA